MSEKQFSSVVDARADPRIRFLASPSQWGSRQANLSVPGCIHVSVVCRKDNISRFQSKTISREELLHGKSWNRFWIVALRFDVRRHGLGR